MDPSNQSVDCSGFYWDAGSIQPDDANVNPLFSQTPRSDEFATSPTWDYPLNQPLELLDHNLDGASGSDVLPIMASAGSPYTRSQSRTVPGESVMGTASCASSKSSLISPHSPSPDKSQNPPKARPQRQRQRTQRQRKASLPQEPQPRQVLKVEMDDDEAVFGGRGDGEGGGGGDGDVKRNKFLQRNRVAASKCRQKKKEWTNQLETTKIGLENQNQMLHMEYNVLVDEVSQIKHQLMIHATCNDSNIDQWIENEARRVVEKSAQRFNGSRVCDAGMCSHEHHRKNSRTLSQPDLPESPSLDTSYDYMPDSLFESIS